MKEKCNCKVKCNVCDCTYNTSNCGCSKDMIEVSNGQNLDKNEKPLESPHFCKSYKQK